MTENNWRRATTPEELMARFPAIAASRPMNPAQNTTVQTMLNGERIAAATSWGNDAAFDPDRNPALYAKARDAHRSLRMTMAADEVVYVTYDGAAYKPDDPHDTATLLNFVGDNRVFVCRNAADRFATMLRHASSDLDPNRRCSINVTDECNNAQDMSWLLPLSMGAHLLVFECCSACRAAVAETAETNYRFGVIAAHERLTETPLPAWARTAPWWARWRAALRRMLRRLA